jgi:uncharacterized repeat protein (TIGR01451 family)
MFLLNSYQRTSARHFLYLLLICCYLMVPSLAFSQIQTVVNFDQVTVSWSQINCPTNAWTLAWGDGCLSNNNPSSGITHTYQACGTYTITLSCLGSPTPPPQTTVVVITKPTAFFSLIPPVTTTDGCGEIYDLTIGVSLDPACTPPLPIPGNITISCSVPSQFIPVSGGSFTVVPNSNTVSLVIPGGTILGTTTNYTLQLRARPCTLPILTKGKFEITGPAGIGLNTGTCDIFSTGSTSTYNELPWSLTPKAACLRVSKTALQPSISAGGTVQYQVTVQNTGTTPATGVQVKDLFPAGFSVVSTPSGSVVGPTMVTTTIPTLAAGATWTEIYSFEHQLPVPFDPCAPPATFDNCAYALIPSCSYQSQTACAGVEVITATMPSNPDFTFEAITCNTFQFIASDTGPGLTHSWNFGDGSANSTSANPTHAYVADGTYMVTHTTTRCGMTATTTIEVVVNCPSNFSCPCTTAGSLNINAGQGTLWTDVPELQGLTTLDLNSVGNCISIKGRLIVNIPTATIFDSDLASLAEIRMQPGAMIQVNGSRLLDISDTDIHGCVQMWQAIKVNQLGKLALNRTTIRDAEFAVDITASGVPPAAGQSSLVAVSNKFLNNHVGIIVKSAGSNATLQHTILRNEFNTSSTLLQSWTTGLANYQSNTGYVGVVALNPQLETYENFFMNLRNGIIVERCKLASSTDRFESMIGAPVDPPFFPSYQSGSQGVGILATRGDLTVKFGTFDRLHTGVFSMDNPIDVLQCAMTSIHRGIWTYQCQDAKVSDNTIDGFEETGISFKTIKPRMKGYEVLRNKLYSANNADFLYDDQWAISVDNIFDNLMPYTGRINENIITMQDHTGGIRVRNVNGWRIGSNDHENSIATANMPVPGYRMENANQTQLKSNFTIGGDKTHGFNTNFSKRCTFCCNTANSSAIGFFFQGSCEMTRFRINQMELTPYCLWFTNMTQISPQSDNANRFYDGFAFHGGSILNIQSSRFFINDINLDGLSNTSDTPWHPPLGATNNLFRPGEQNIQNTCGQDSICDNLIPEPPTIRWDSTLATAASPLKPDATVMEITQQWEAQRVLYEGLYKNTAWPISDPILNQFYSEQINGGSVGQFYEAEEAIQRILGQPKVWTDALAQYSDSLAAYEKWMEDELLNLSDAKNIEDSIAIIQNISWFVQQGVIWNERRDSIGILMKTWQQHETDLIAASLGALPEDHPAMQNRKKVLQVLVQILKMDDFTLLDEQDIEFISTLATQCPLEGGTAVYLARSIHSQLVPDQIFDDQQGCGVAERELPNASLTKTMSNRLLLYPNPAQDRLEVRWTNAHAHGGILRVWSSDGRVISQQQVASDMRGVTLDASRYPDGLYYCQYRTESGITLSGTLLIQH